MFKKIKKILCTSIIISMLNQVAIPIEICVKAKTIKEKIKNNNSKINDLNKQKSAQNKTQKDLEKNISKVNSEIKNLNGQIKNMKSQTYKNQELINGFMTNIENLNNQIKNIDADLNSTLEISNNLKKELANYMKDIYINGNNNMLELFFSSENFVEFVNNIQYFKNVSGQVKNLINSYNEHMLKINQNKKAKEEEIRKINIEKENITKKINENNQHTIEMESLIKNQYQSYENLNNLLKQTNKKTKDISDAISTLQKLTDKFEKEKQDTEKAVEMAIKKQNIPPTSNQPQNAPNNKNPLEKQNQQQKNQVQSKGHIFPVKGKCSISQPFRRGHSGIDIQTCGKPNPVVASMEGKVITASKGGKANKLSGYGNVVMILHPDQTVTLYAHLSSVAVKVNQTVSKGQFIGNVGNTGNVSGKTGMHLHYEQRKNAKPCSPKFG